MIVLTPEEEQRVIDDYSRIAWAFVHRFSDGKASSLYSKEDLHQECMMVFVKHMAKCESKEELMHFHTMDLVNAMTRYVLKNQPVRLDHNRTSAVKATLKNVPDTFSLTDVEYYASSDLNPIDETVERIALEQFIAQPTTRELEKEALLGVSNGSRITEVAQRIGRSTQVVFYALKTARQKYREFVA